MEELERQIADASALATGGDFQGPYFTEAQIWGRVQFVCWINPGRRPTFLRKYRAVPWKKVNEVARKRRLVMVKG